MTRQLLLTLRPASLLWRFISIRANDLECLGWFFSRSRTSTKALANLYPYSMLSPQPPQIQSLWRSLGRRARLQPHLLSSALPQDRLMACTTPAADTACVKAASRLAVGVDRKTTDWIESVMTKKMMEMLETIMMTPIARVWESLPSWLFTWTKRQHIGLRV